MLPLILGLSGPKLTAAERTLFAAADPAGYILFGRNVQNPVQLRALTDDLRSLSGRGNLPILVDQEGGRVQRLTPPHWRAHPPAELFGRLWDIAPMTAIEAARFHAMAIGAELHAAGISVDCLPLVDVPVAGAHDVIGDRAFGRDPHMVASLGAAILSGLREAGICGIVKHIPGHGRAEADSHEALPLVTATAEELTHDLLPFQKLNDAPMAMTAHVTYAALDPDHCASVSHKVIEGTIRGDIGFGGLLMCDDLGMHALAGSLTERMRAALAAGCDAALHCSGDFAENSALAEHAPSISTAARGRLDAAMIWADAEPDICADAAERRDALIESGLA
ncbi:beta-N-acetylhexosaminidase [Pacificimonas sp. WHA3]|uniref:Beta-N-acetylhexosaminidase n=1 Tax=Pacificimonas pallii TaxID=2827236 RepID=A0ABS6SEN8_9SPHN|nr:beta-N-acetylhexosaminidase [Pacificimonas pallii]MBV7256868.1 beta-N-acetylhexosaminidase [Pacificimonas pallii]